MVFICNDPYPSNSNYESYFELYSFPLSDFQKYAIEAIVTGNHVLVTAHTGSGKTLPAEFAIEHFVKQGKRVIYTSPIKALSNQKYYEFTKKYPEISFGLFTGDIKTNPTADVLIMTTEILMNYLFINPSNETENPSLQFQIDIQNDLACVVFDEIHYINDADRGQTWEQTILMLPKHIQMVMLSATIDNPVGFAKWCKRSDGNKSEKCNEDKRGEKCNEEQIDTEKKVYLASTNHRVVPLTHYGFLTTNESIYKTVKDKEIQKQVRDSTNKLLLLQSANGIFNEKSFYQIQKNRDLFEKHRLFMKRKFVLTRLTEYLRDNEMLPAIVFVFSRKNVELCATEITTRLLEDDSKVPYNVRRECEQIVRKFPNYKEYIELPEYNELVGLLEKGIGIHHSGMIPVLREIVEIMISKKYIKLLFATESFAIGLDCPIKTAVFSSLSKFDGSGLRNLFSHEYTQMAGRAGRRGIDTIGHVVHCNNLFDFPVINDYKMILSGKPQALVSKFHVSYNMILNLMKNGQSNHFESFVEKSMIANELNISANSYENTIKNMEQQIETKREFMKHLRTPIDVCEHFIDIQKNISMYANKKRKEIEREVAGLKETHRWITEDVLKINELINMEREYEKEKSHLNYLEFFIKNQIEKVCGILEKNGFIQQIESDSGYELTSLGKISSNIAEIHSLIASKIIENTNYFAAFSVQQLIALFSCFTDIKVTEEYKSITPQTEDLLLKSILTNTKNILSELEDTEIKEELYTGIKYENILMYDLIPCMNGWCECDTEQQCKYFIQTVIKEKEISIGEFTKAVLKIATISKEFINVCQQIGDDANELLFKLSQIEPLILKYITTNQSLYI